MATNSYFRNFDAKNEQELLHSLVTESIQVYGHDVSYIPRTLVNEDTILGEDSISEYKDAHSIEMYIKSVDGFEGEGDLISIFGLISIYWFEKYNLLNRFSIKHNLNYDIAI